jgi:DNA-binding beta-propeller fold protein YncE
MSYSEQGQSVWSINNPTGNKGLFAVDKVGQGILFFEPNEFRLEESISIRGAHELAIDAQHRFAYVAAFGKWGRNAAGQGALVEPEAAVWVVDLAERRIVKRIDTWPHIGPHGMKFDGDGRLWTTFESGAVGYIDVGEGKLRDIYPIPDVACPPRVLEISEDGKRLYTAGKGADIFVFDIDRREWTARIALAEGGTTLSMARDDRLVTFDRANQDLLVVDTQANTIAARLPTSFSVFSGPKVSNIVHGRFSHDSKLFACANYATGAIQLHDGETMAELGMVLVAKGPQGVVFTPDGTRLLVANHDCGIVTVIDLASLKATGWFAAGTGVEALTFF